MTAYRYLLGTGMMAAGLGAAVASGQGLAFAAAEETSSSASSGTSASDRPPATGSAPRARTESAARSPREIRRLSTSRRNARTAQVAASGPRTVEVEAVLPAGTAPTDDSAGAAPPVPDVQTPGPVEFDRPRTFVGTRPPRPERRSQTVVADAVEQPDVPAGAANVSAPTAALPTQAYVAATKPVTIAGFLKNVLSRVGFRFTLPRGLQNWWRDVRQRIFGVPAKPVVLPPTDPVTQNPGGPNRPVLLWETNFTDIAEAMQAWSMQTGRWGQSAGENQYYTPDFSNVSIDADGHLVIEVRREAAPDGAPAPHDYTSARVVTYGKQSVEPPVRIVARLQMPYTQGTLPAFWMVGLEPGHEFDWPRQGEIDIVEYPGFRDDEGRTTWTGNIHGPATADNTVDVKLHTVGADLGIDLSAGFHDYGIDWYPDRIVWHVDGVETGRVTRAQYEALGGDWTPFSGAWSHYLILNTAVGNPWTGDPDSSAQFPQAMKVDWVRVYSLAGIG
jgi:beta-glucanase (GH16 family)